MRRSLTFFVVITSFVGLAACAGDDSRAGSDGGADGGVDGAVATGDGGGTGFPSLPTTPVAEGDFAAVTARAWCEYQGYCNCLDDQPTVAACTDYWVDRFGTYSEMSRDMGLTYDAACVDRFFRELEARQCGENVAWSYQDAFRCTCAAYHGSIAEGEACAPIGIDGFTQCAQGLRCDGTCVSSCHNRVAPGRACDPTGVGAVCIPPAGLCMDGTCTALPGVGEPCSSLECDGEDAYCDSETRTCVANAPRGAACEDSGECDTRNCQDGVCVSSCPFWPFLGGG